MHWSGRFKEAFCIGGIYATSSLLPGKIQHLIFHLKSIDRYGTDGIADHALTISGLFILLSVLTWLQEGKERPIRPFNAYPPHSKTVVSAHIAGLVVGVVLMLA